MRQKALLIDKNAIVCHNDHLTPSMASKAK